MQVEAPVAPVTQVQPTVRPEPIVVSIGMKLRDAEKLILERTIENLKGNKKEAAKVLGISRSALYAKLKRFGLPA